MAGVSGIVAGAMKRRIEEVGDLPSPCAESGWRTRGICAWSPSNVGRDFSPPGEHTTWSGAGFSTDPSEWHTTSQPLADLRTAPPHCYTSFASSSLPALLSPCHMGPEKQLSCLVGTRPLSRRSPSSSALGKAHSFTVNCSPRSDITGGTAATLSSRDTQYQGSLGNNWAADAPPLFCPVDKTESTEAQQQRKTFLPSALDQLEDQPGHPAQEPLTLAQPEELLSRSSFFLGLWGEQERVVPQNCERVSMESVASLDRVQRHSGNIVADAGVESPEDTRNVRSAVSNEDVSNSRGGREPAYYIGSSSSVRHSLRPREMSSEMADSSTYPASRFLSFFSNSPCPPSPTAESQTRPARAGQLEGSFHAAPELRGESTSLPAWAFCSIALRRTTSLGTVDAASPPSRTSLGETSDCTTPALGELSTRRHSSLRFGAAALAGRRFRSSESPVWGRRCSSPPSPPSAGPNETTEPGPLSASSGGAGCDGEKSTSPSSNRHTLSSEEREHGDRSCSGNHEQCVVPSSAGTPARLSNGDSGCSPVPFSATRRPSWPIGTEAPESVSQAVSATMTGAEVIRHSPSTLPACLVRATQDDGCTRRTEFSVSRDSRGSSQPSSSSISRGSSRSRRGPPVAYTTLAEHSPENFSARFDIAGDEADCGNQKRLQRNPVLSEEPPRAEAEEKIADGTKKHPVHGKILSDRPWTTESLVFSRCSYQTPSLFTERLSLPAPPLSAPQPCLLFVDAPSPCCSPAVVGSKSHSVSTCCVGPPAASANELPVQAKAEGCGRESECLFNAPSCKRSAEQVSLKRTGCSGLSGLKARPAGTLSEAASAAGKSTSASGETAVGSYPHAGLDCGRDHRHSFTDIVADVESTRTPDCRLASDGSSTVPEPLHRCPNRLPQCSVSLLDRTAAASDPEPSAVQPPLSCANSLFPGAVPTSSPSEDRGLLPHDQHRTDIFAAGGEKSTGSEVAPSVLSRPLNNAPPSPCLAASVPASAVSPAKRIAGRPQCVAGRKKAPEKVLSASDAASAFCRTGVSASTCSDALEPYYQQHLKQLQQLHRQMRPSPSSSSTPSLFSHTTGHSSIRDYAFPSGTSERAFPGAPLPGKTPLQLQERSRRSTGERRKKQHRGPLATNDQGSKVLSPEEASCVGLGTPASCLPSRRRIGTESRPAAPGPTSQSSAGLVSALPGSYVSSLCACASCIEKATKPPETLTGLAAPPAFLPDEGLQGQRHRLAMWLSQVGNEGQGECATAQLHRQLLQQLCQVQSAPDRLEARRLSGPTALSGQFHSATGAVNTQADAALSQQRPSLLFLLQQYQMKQNGRKHPESAAAIPRELITATPLPLKVHSPSALSQVLHVAGAGGEKSTGCNDTLSSPLSKRGSMPGGALPHVTSPSCASVDGTRRRHMVRDYGETTDSACSRVCSRRDRGPTAADSTSSPGSLPSPLTTTKSPVLQSHDCTLAWRSTARLLGASGSCTSSSGFPSQVWPARLYRPPHSNQLRANQEPNRHPSALRYTGADSQPPRSASPYTESHIATSLPSPTPSPGRCSSGSRATTHSPGPPSTAGSSLSSDAMPSVSPVSRQQSGFVARSLTAQRLQVLKSTSAPLVGFPPAPPLCKSQGVSAGAAPFAAPSAPHLGHKAGPPTDMEPASPALSSSSSCFPYSPSSLSPLMSTASRSLARGGSRLTPLELPRAQAARGADKRKRPPSSSCAHGTSATDTADSKVPAVPAHQEDQTGAVRNTRINHHSNEKASRAPRRRYATPMAETATDSVPALTAAHSSAGPFFSQAATGCPQNKGGQDMLFRGSEKIETASATRIDISRLNRSVNQGSTSVASCTPGVEPGARSTPPYSPGLPSPAVLPPGASALPANATKTNGLQHNTFRHAEGVLTNTRPREGTPSPWIENATAEVTLPQLQMLRQQLPEIWRQAVQLLLRLSQQSEGIKAEKDEDDRKSEGRKEQRPDAGPQQVMCDDGATKSNSDIQNARQGEERAVGGERSTGDVTPRGKATGKEEKGRQFPEVEASGGNPDRGSSGTPQGPSRLARPLRDLTQHSSIKGLEEGSETERVANDRVAVEGLTPRYSPVRGGQTLSEQPAECCDRRGKQERKIARQHGKREEMTKVAKDQEKQNGDGSSCVARSKGKRRGSSSEAGKEPQTRTPTCRKEDKDDKFLGQKISEDGRREDPDSRQCCKSSPKHSPATRQTEKPLPTTPLQEQIGGRKMLEKRVCPDAEVTFEDKQITVRSEATKGHRLTDRKERERNPSPGGKEKESGSRERPVCEKKRKPESLSHVGETARSPQGTPRTKTTDQAKKRKHSPTASIRRGASEDQRIPGQSKPKLSVPSEATSVARSDLVAPREVGQDSWKKSVCASESCFSPLNTIRASPRGRPQEPKASARVGSTREGSNRSSQSTRSVVGKSRHRGHKTRRTQSRDSQPETMSCQAEIIVRREGRCEESIDNTLRRRRRADTNKDGSSGRLMCPINETKTNVRGEESSFNEDVNNKEASEKDKTLGAQTTDICGDEESLGDKTREMKRNERTPRVCHRRKHSPSSSGGRGAVTNDSAPGFSSSKATEDSKPVHRAKASSSPRPIPKGQQHSVCLRTGKEYADEGVKSPQLPEAVMSVKRSRCGNGRDNVGTVDHCSNSKGATKGRSTRTLQEGGMTCDDDSSADSSRDGSQVSDKNCRSRSSSSRSDSRGGGVRAEEELGRREKKRFKGKRELHNKETRHSTEQALSEKANLGGGGRGADHGSQQVPSHRSVKGPEGKGNTKQRSGERSSGDRNGETDKSDDRKTTIHASLPSRNTSPPGWAVSRQAQQNSEPATRSREALGLMEYSGDQESSESAKQKKSTQHSNEHDNRETKSDTKDVKSLPLRAFIPSYSPDSDHKSTHQEKRTLDKGEDQRKCKVAPFVSSPAVVSAEADRGSKPPRLSPWGPGHTRRSEFDKGGQQLKPALPLEVKCDELPSLRVPRPNPLHSPSFRRTAVEPQWDKATERTWGNTILSIAEKCKSQITQEEGGGTVPLQPIIGSSITSPPPKADLSCVAPRSSFGVPGRKRHLPTTSAELTLSTSREGRAFFEASGRPPEYPCLLLNSGTVSGAPRWEARLVRRKVLSRESTLLDSCVRRHGFSSWMMSRCSTNSGGLGTLVTAGDTRLRKAGPIGPSTDDLRKVVTAHMNGHLPSHRQTTLPRSFWQGRDDTCPSKKRDIRDKRAVLCHNYRLQGSECTRVQGTRQKRQQLQRRDGKGRKQQLQQQRSDRVRQEDLQRTHGAAQCKFLLPRRFPQSSVPHVSRGTIAGVPRQPADSRSARSFFPSTDSGRTHASHKRQKRRTKARKERNENSEWRISSSGSEQRTPSRHQPERPDGLGVDAINSKVIKSNYVNLSAFLNDRRWGLQSDALSFPSTAGNHCHAGTPTPVVSMQPRVERNNDSKGNCRPGTTAQVDKNALKRSRSPSSTPSCDSLRTTCSSLSPIFSPASLNLSSPCPSDAAALTSSQTLGSVTSSAEQSEWYSTTVDGAETSSSVPPPSLSWARGGQTEKDLASVLSQDPPPSEKQNGLGISQTTCIEEVPTSPSGSPRTERGIHTQATQPFKG